MYSKTYVGIAVIVLGWLGVSDLISESEISTIVDHVLQLGGIVYAIYGRFKAGGVSVLGFKN